MGLNATSDITQAWISSSLGRTEVLTPGSPLVVTVTTNRSELLTLTATANGRVIRRDSFIATREVQYPITVNDSSVPAHTWVVIAVTHVAVPLRIYLK